MSCTTFSKIFLEGTFEIESEIEITPNGLKNFQRRLSGKQKAYSMKFACEEISSLGRKQEKIKNA